MTDNLKETMSSIEILEDNNEFLKDYSKGDDMFYYRYIIGFDAIKELKKDIDRYRWHDLTTAPEDLPANEYTEVLCKHDDHFSVSCKSEILPYTKEYPYSSVIAWRYIEELESESEEDDK